MSDSRSMPYQPALDGLRAVAVALVLAFHGGVSWMRGGYVGVSVFFTLSGYLITALLLREHDRTGTVSLHRFYARRVKRLLPASLLCLAAVVVASSFGAFENVSSLRRDTFGALFQVANWVKLFGSGSYAELTDATLGRVAPLEHYWSLAIEEQFYWVWPLVMLALLGRVSTAAGRLRWLVGMAVVAAAAAPVIAGTWGPDAAYWSTPARAGEILVGAAVAAALQRYRAVPGFAAPRYAGAVTAVGLIAIGWAAATWSSASGPAYSGWLPVFALATAAVIVGVQHDSVVRKMMSLAPVVWVGTISYGLYLYHWPIFAALTDARLGLDGVALLAVRIAATVAVATLSAAIVERPVREWSPVPARPLVAALAATAFVAFAVAVVVDPATTTAVDVTAAAIVPVDGPLVALQLATSTAAPAVAPVAAPSTTTSAAAQPGSTNADPPAVDDVEPVASVASLVPLTVPTPTRPVRIIVIGDSTAQALAVGFVDWAVDHPDVAQVSVAAAPGCGFIRDGVIPTDGAIDFAGRCATVLDEELPAMAHELEPDAAWLMVTMRDAEDRIWHDDEGALSPFDERFRERLLADYRTLADDLLSAGIDHLVWVLAPHPASPFEGEQRKMLDPARYEVQFGVIEEVARERPEVITVVDLNGWMADLDLITDAGLRPDGLHLTEAASRWLFDVYLAGTVVSSVT